MSSPKAKSTNLPPLKPNKEIMELPNANERKRNGEKLRQFSDGVSDRQGFRHTRKRIGRRQAMRNWNVIEQRACGWIVG